MTKTGLVFVLLFICHGTTGFLSDDKHEDGTSTIGRYFPFKTTNGAVTSLASVTPSPNSADLPSRLFLSVPYKSYNFPVYKVGDSNTTSVQYHYLPSVFVNPRTAKSKFNKLRQRDEVSFTVSMWDEGYKHHIHCAIENATAAPISLDKLRLRDIFMYRISVVVGSFPGLSLARNWTSYTSHPGTITVKFICDTNQTCQDAMEVLENSPEDLFHELTMSYRFSDDEASDWHEPLKLIPDRQTVPGVEDLRQFVEAQTSLVRRELQVIEVSQNFTQQQISILKDAHTELRNATAGTDSIVSTLWRSVNKLNSETASVRQELQSVAKDPVTVIQREIRVALTNATAGIHSKLADYDARMRQLAALVDASQQQGGNCLSKISGLQILFEDLRSLMAQNQVLKTGTIVAFHSSGSVPEGWLECNGQLFNQTGYTKLYQLLGTSRTPDLRNRFLIGSERTSVGKTGGRAEHTLTVDEMPQHTHPYRKAQPGFVFKGPSMTKSSTETNYQYYADSATNPVNELGQHILSDSGQKTSAAGSSRPHNNIPPYTAVRFVIKT